MRIFLAGATGVLGVRLVPLLTAAGHAVAGMTRSADKTEQLRSLGAEPVVCDVYDGAALTEAVVAFAPDMVMHQLTDLPDSLEELGEYAARNDRIRSEGTANLLAAARESGAKRFLAQSISWRPAGRGESLDAFEQTVLSAGGVVLRYGQLYGPGTFYEDAPPEPPRVHVDEAARRTLDYLGAPSGIVVVNEP